MEAERPAVLCDVRTSSLDHDLRKRAPVLGVTHSDPGFALPTGACDCHIHVFEPARFPLAARRTYTPSIASPTDLRQFLTTLGLSRAVLVQPSPYDTDNRLLLHALEGLGADARGVAAIDQSLTPADLRRMHESGVRGTRLNLATFGTTDPAAVADVLTHTARQVESLGWHIQIHARLPLVARLAPVLAELPTPVVVDHFGYASLDLSKERDEREALLRLIAGGKVYVKLSATHRVGPADDGTTARALARALIEAHPGRVLWGSDWPHTSSLPAQRHKDRVEPFEPIDDGLALQRLFRWTSAQEREQILVDNPAALYDFARPS